jgi:hypothetical protein
MKPSKHNKERRERVDQRRYEPPKIVSLTQEMLLEELGPATANYGRNGCIVGLDC